MCRHQHNITFPVLIFGAQNFHLNTKLNYVIYHGWTWTDTISAWYSIFSLLAKVFYSKMYRFHHWCFQNIWWGKSSNKTIIYNTRFFIFICCPNCCQKLLLVDISWISLFFSIASVTLSGDMFQWLMSPSSGWWSFLCSLVHIVHEVDSVG